MGFIVVAAHYYAIAIVPKIELKIVFSVFAFDKNCKIANKMHAE